MENFENKSERKEDEPNTRLVSLESGADWADASYNLVEIPVDLNLKQEHQAYRQWVEDVYQPGLRSGEKLKHKTFTEWLVEKGIAKEAKFERFEE